MLVSPVADRSGKGVAIVELVDVMTVRWDCAVGMCVRANTVCGGRHKTHHRDTEAQRKPNTRKSTYFRQSTSPRNDICAGLLELAAEAGELLFQVGDFFT